MPIELRMLGITSTEDEKQIMEAVGCFLLGIGFVSFPEFFAYTTNEKQRIVKELTQQRNKLNRQIATLKKAKLQN